METDPIDDDMSFEIISEEYDIYEANDKIISVKPMISQIIKTKAYNIEGEPIYVVNSNPIIKTTIKRN